MRRARRKRGRRNLLIVAVVAILIASFLVRRVFAPAAMRSLAAPRPHPGASAPAMNQSLQSPTEQRGSEQLSDRDRRTLDTVVRDKSR